MIFKKRLSFTAAKEHLRTLGIILSINEERGEYIVRKKEDPERSVRVYRTKDLQDAFYIGINIAAGYQPYTDIIRGKRILNPKKFKNPYEKDKETQWDEFPIDHGLDLPLRENDSVFENLKTVIYHLNGNRLYATLSQNNVNIILTLEKNSDGSFKIIERDLKNAKTLSSLDIVAKLGNNNISVYTRLPRTKYWKFEVLVSRNTRRYNNGISLYF